MHVTRKAFDEMVEKAIDSLPPEYAEWVEEVPIIVEDRPSEADMRGMENPEEVPLGMFVGQSKLEGEDGGLPPRIMIYREPLMEACRDSDELAEEIRSTIIHELGHHAGFDEEGLEEHGFGDKEEDDEIEFDVEE